jgi:hypothetical protein
MSAGKSPARSANGFECLAFAWTPALTHPHGSHDRLSVSIDFVFQFQFDAVSIKHC